MTQHTKTGGSVYNMEKPQEKVCNRSGKHIREARTKAGMTQTQLADALREMGIATSTGSICRMEKGKQRVTDYELQAISIVLKVSPEVLCGMEGFFQAIADKSEEQQ
jgi:DNA-binding helix-turn-helix protein